MLARTRLLLDNVFLPDAPGDIGPRHPFALYLRRLCGTARSHAGPRADARDAPPVRIILLKPLEMSDRLCESLPARKNCFRWIRWQKLLMTNSHRISESS